MTDINKQIEEERILDDIELEALKYARQEYPNSTKPIQAIVAGDCSRFAKQILHSSRWRKVSEELPEEGEEVLFFHEDWIDEDFNPKGIRIGFYESGYYVTAKWSSIQDCYMTLSHPRLLTTAKDKTRNSIEPQRWKPID